MSQNANNHYSSDEINLRELFQTLWASKLLIIAITVAATCIAIAYALLATPIYRTSVHTLPPTANGLASYNVASQLTGDAIRGATANSESGIAPLSTQAAYRTFLRHLNSATIRQAFFEEYYLPAQEENETEADKQRAWKRLDDELSITLPRGEEQFEASLNLEGAQPKTIAQWANAYVDLARQAASEELLSGLTGEVEIRRLSLVDQVSTLRHAAKKSRQDSITRLKNALTIAESIGLENPAEGATLIALNTQGLNTENINSGSLLYLRGSKALRAEIQQLEQRESDDAYIAELPSLLKRQALLNSINLNADLMSVATIDRAAIVPEEPIKPHKILIILLGLLLGGMLGVSCVLFRRLVTEK